MVIKSKNSITQVDAVSRQVEIPSRGHRDALKDLGEATCQKAFELENSDGYQSVGTIAQELCVGKGKGWRSHIGEIRKFSCYTNLGHPKSTLLIIRALY